MVDGGQALGITLPKRAPGVDIKSARDALIDGAGSPYAVINHPEVMRRIHGTDSVNLLRVYCAYAGHVNAVKGVAFPSHERLAVALGVSKKTVSRAMHELERRGLVKLTRMATKAGKGYLNVVQIVFGDGTLTPADVQSIASYPQRRNGQHSVQHDAPDLSTGNAPYRTPPQTPYRTPNCPSPVVDTQVSTGTVEHINPIVPLLETAEQVIEQWQAYAWMHGHGSATPIANEQDLETAHALVAQGITAAELEHAINANPGCDRLAPLVYALLP